WQRALARDHDVGLLELGEHASARGDIALPLLAQLDRPGRAIQQLRVGLLFEERDRAADRGGRATELATRRREAPFVDRDDEHLHCIEAIHAASAIGGPWPKKLPTRSRDDNGHVRLRIRVEADHHHPARVTGLRARRTRLTTRIQTRPMTGETK